MDLENASKLTKTGLQSLQETELVTEVDLAEEFRGKVNIYFEEQTLSQIVNSLPQTMKQVTITKYHYMPNNSNKISMENMTDICPICLSVFEIGEKLINGRRCQHLFHYTCLEEWLVNSNEIGSSKMTCPLCRKSV